MIFTILLALFGATLSAVIDPSLTEWHLIETNEERHQFPLRDYILEVKAFLPDEYDTNPSYGELVRTDKSTTMMMLLHEGNYNNKVGRLVWNTIKYDRGFDVSIEECDRKYKAYKSFPAGGKKEQIWAWNFFDDNVELTCDGEIQYERSFDEGETHPFVAVTNPQNCRALGDAEVDRIVFKHMKGKYIRGIPKDGKIVPTEPVKPETEKPETEKPTTVKPSTAPPTPDADDIITDKPYPTCNCWTAECGYCSNLDCTVKQDLINSERGVQVTSTLKRKRLNSIVLYDEAGEEIGKFQWNLRGIWMTGCIGCLTPAKLRRARADEGQTTWEFTLTNGVVRIMINGEALYEHRLIGECKEAYSKTTRFAFYDMTCENTFLYRPDDMELGDRVTPTCAGQCPSENGQ